MLPSGKMSPCGEPFLTLPNQHHPHVPFEPLALICFSLELVSSCYISAGVTLGTMRAGTLSVLLVVISVELGPGPTQVLPKYLLNAWLGLRRWDLIPPAVY